MASLLRKGINWSEEPFDFLFIKEDYYSILANSGNISCCKEGLVLEVWDLYESIVVVCENIKDLCTLHDLLIHHIGINGPIFVNKNFLDLIIKKEEDVTLFFEYLLNFADTVKSNTASITYKLF